MPVRMRVYVELSFFNGTSFDPSIALIIFGAIVAKVLTTEALPSLDVDDRKTSCPLPKTAGTKLSKSRTGSFS